MKYGKRIAAFALSLVVAFGAVTYRQPKAHAVAGATLGTAALASYMTATGVPLTVISGGASAAASGVTSIAAGYAAATGTTSSAVLSSIAAGATISTSGAIILGVGAVALLAGITAWLINEYGLIGEDGVPVTDPVYIVEPSLQALMEDGSHMPVYLAGDSTTNFAPASDALHTMPSNALTETGVYRFASGGYLNVFTSGNKLQAKFYRPGYLSDYTSWVNSTGNLDIGGFLFGVFTSKTWNTQYACLFIYDDNGQYLQTNTFGYPECTPINLYGSYSMEGGLSVSLPADYEAAPDIDENHSMIIDTGFSYEDDQSFHDAVMNGLAANTFTPTYTIEQTTTGDVTVPDEGEDTDDEQVGILDWTKKIWQSVQELPRTIADAVANVFVPSAEYMEAVPETISSTFDNRTGFLTYPTSVLYDFADMLTSGSEDFILEWPDVRDPASKAVMLEAGEFNVTKFVRDNESLADVYTIYQYVAGAYLTFLFLGLCRRKYNSVIGDRLGG